MEISRRKLFSLVAYFLNLQFLFFQRPVKGEIGSNNFYVGYNKPLDKLQEVLPKMEGDLDKANRGSVIKQTEEYWYCFETGCLIRIELAGEKSRFTLILLPFEDRFSQAVPTLVTEKEITSFGVDVKHLLNLAVQESPYGGGGVKARFRTTLTKESILSIRERFHHPK